MCQNIVTAASKDYRASLMGVKPVLFSSKISFWATYPGLCTQKCTCTQSSALKSATFTHMIILSRSYLFPRMPNVEDIVCNVSLSIPHDAVGIVLQKIQDWLRPREGVIIKWPLNGQFHDAVTDVLMSPTAVSGVVENISNVVNVI